MLLPARPLGVDVWVGALGAGVGCLVLGGPRDGGRLGGFVAPVPRRAPLSGRKIQTRSKAVLARGFSIPNTRQKCSITNTNGLDMV